MVKILNELRRDAEGSKVLRDWLGDDGIPVMPDHAQHRAEACARGNYGHPCPYNYVPRWWNLVDMAKDAIATAIRYQLEFKHHLNMHVSNEDQIGTCTLCGCNLPLKVWTPIQYMKDHLTPDKIEKYPPEWCWQRREAENKTL